MEAVRAEVNGSNLFQGLAGIQWSKARGRLGVKKNPIESLEFRTRVRQLPRPRMGSRLFLQNLHLKTHSSLWKP